MCTTARHIFIALIMNVYRKMISSISPTVGLTTRYVTRYMKERNYRYLYYLYYIFTFTKI